MFFKNSIVRTAIFLVSLGLCVNAARTIVSLWQRHDLITNRQQDLEHIASENASLQAQLDETETDQYVERIARDKLGMVKDGETMILLPERGKQESGTAYLPDTDVNWKRWLKLFL